MDAALAPALVLMREGNHIPLKTNTKGSVNIEKRFDIEST